MVYKEKNVLQNIALLTCLKQYIAIETKFKKFQRLFSSDPKKWLSCTLRNISLPAISGEVNVNRQVR